MNGNELALYISGAFVSPFLLWVKNTFALEGTLMFVVTLLTSIIVATIVFVLTEEPLTADMLLTGLSKILATATVVYNFAIAPRKKD